MNFIIETNNLTKNFKNKVAVDHVSLSVAKGDIYGLIGKNGAGKTTLLKLLLGLLRPNDGSMTLLNEADPDVARHRIGSLIEAPGLFRNETAYENMKRFSILYGADESEINELLDFVGLKDVGNKKIKAFSLGMRQRLGIAIALLGKPEILLLDEPINGLDPSGIKDIRDTIIRSNQERGVTFIISSHLLDELGKVATRYGIISNGKMVEQITKEELEDKCGHYLLIKTNNNQKASSFIKEKYPNVIINEKDDCLIISNNVEHSGEINSLLVKNDFTVFRLETRQMDVESYFVERINQ